MTPDSILTALQALECELHQPNVRHDAARLAELLDPQFREIGRSGRSYRRADIFEHLPAETQSTKVHAQDFSLVELAEGVYLLSYRSAHIAPSGALEHHTNRSSVWRLDATGWRMVFHQGTPTEAFAQNSI